MWPIPRTSDSSHITTRGNMKLTKPQLKRFWPLWTEAENENLPHNATRAQRDAIRRDTIQRATGRHSLKDVNPVGEFDALMLEVATLAGDYEEAAYWGAAKERRYAVMMEDCARQIGEITGNPHGWQYCRDTLTQARLPDRWEDVPETLLAKTFQMLDTHRRRLLCRAWGKNTGLSLAFKLGQAYELIDGTVYCIGKPIKQPRAEHANPVNPVNPVKEQTSPHMEMSK